MLTYQARPRYFKFRDALPSLPAPALIEFQFAPSQPFGASELGGRTVLKDTAPTMRLDMNSGAFEIQSFLKPIEVVATTGRRRFTWRGNILTMEIDRVCSLAELGEAVEDGYLALPLLLNLNMADPPYVQLVHGALASVPFSWELEEWRPSMEVTTQERQQQRIEQACQRLAMLDSVAQRRLAAALHYFHVACRVTRMASLPGEFMAEAVLNFSKVLEALFPPDKAIDTKGETMDPVRRALSSLGFTTDEIEGDYITAMLLRSYIDSGHVQLTLMKQDQLSTIHEYVDQAEQRFRVLLRRVVDAVEDGSLQVKPYVQEPGGKAKEITDRIAENLKRLRRPPDNTRTNTENDVPFEIEIRRRSER